jgi:hypothetical protein
MPEVLSQAQIDEYREVGGIVVEGRLSQADLDEIRAAIARSYEEAQGLEASTERLDLEDSHTPTKPRIRRIKLPHTQYEVFQRLMTSDAILAPARDLIGPDLRLHTTKLNMKSAGFGAAVEWHQDMAFYPHTNDDVLAIGVMIDDMGLENGPLMIFPGSHRGPTYDHHADGVFVGAVDLAASGLNVQDALNRSDRDRRLLFYEMMAADSFPVMGSMTGFASLEEYNERMLCGMPTIEPRLSDWPVRIPLPQPSERGSIYEIQKGLKHRGFSIYDSQER